jgi:CRP-like cAMP-binding protein
MKATAARQPFSSCSTAINRAAVGENRLLAALSEEELRRLSVNLKPIRFKRGAILFRAGETVENCYLPLSGIISLLSNTADGKALIIGMVGDEGLAGITGLLRPRVAPYEVMAQTEVYALRVKSNVLAAEFARAGHFQQAVLRYFHLLLFQISQSAVCHRFHTVERRLARWLLVAADRLHSDEFSLTQKCLAHLLGVPRTNVTMTASQLQNKRMISYKYGKIKIVDRRGLEMAACECRAAVKRETDAFYQ